MTLFLACDKSREHRITGTDRVYDITLIRRYDMKLARAVDQVSAKASRGDDHFPCTHRLKLFGFDQDLVGIERVDLRSAYLGQFFDIRLYDCRVVLQGVQEKV